MRQRVQGNRGWVIGRHGQHSIEDVQSDIAHVNVLQLLSYDWSVGNKTLEGMLLQENEQQYGGVLPHRCEEMIHCWASFIKIYL